MPKKILITGISGQMGSNMAYLLYEHFKDVSLDVLGIYNTKYTYSNYIKIVSSSGFFEYGVSKGFFNFNPDLIIHCAALTNMDLCEAHPDLAFRSNVLFTKNICELFPDSKFVYISTDNVYYGGNYIYNEEDITVSKNNYGSTKLAGEDVVKKTCNDYLIFRTNIYGWDNRTMTNSFLERIYRNFANGSENRLFYDVFYCPISINLLFDVLIECLRNDLSGTYNVVGPSLSKLEFGKLIADVFGFDRIRITPISIEKLSLKAQRPKILNISNRKIFNFYPRVDMSTLDQLNNMKAAFKAGYRDKLAKFINIGD